MPGKLGGSNPIFAHGKNVSFPIFPHGENGKKSIWKKREKYSFPSLSIYFFPHFFPWGKNWERHNFHMGKNGVGPPKASFWQFCRKLPYLQLKKPERKIS